MFESRADANTSLGASQKATYESATERAAVKLVALGDVHGQWAQVWAALRAAGAADAMCEPTPALREGRIRVVFSGDLVHYKDEASYARAVGEARFNPRDPKQLRRAAKAQIRELHRLKAYLGRAAGHVSVILGNHDEAVLENRYTLATRGGLEHLEFSADRGGLELPQELAAWFSSFPRERVLSGVHFAHAGPLPGMRSFDDFFYHDPDTKGWWRDKPELARQSGHRFGVYGHTPVAGGVYLDLGHGFAMVDALGARQFLELYIEGAQLEPRVVQF